MNDQEFTTLANGGELNKESFNEFVSRLTHDCRGEGVKEHVTSNAIFNVQYKKLVTGIDADYANNIGCYLDDYFYKSINEFIDSIDLDSHFVFWLESNHGMSLDELKLDGSASDVILAFDEDDVGWRCLTICGYDYEWAHLNSHFTKEAAETFIGRKKHNYGEMRVYVDSQYFALEFNSIMGAIMDGKLVLAEESK